jgi:hypothetical protein
LLRVERGKGGKSLPSRKRGTAMQCCRHSSSNCCASDGGRGGGVACCCREAGCFPAATGRTAVGPPVLSWRPHRPPRPRGLKSACRHTRCGTASLPTSSSKTVKRHAIGTPDRHGKGTP